MKIGDKNMDREYIAPEAEIILFETESVMDTSHVSEKANNPFEIWASSEDE